MLKFKITQQLHNSFTWLVQLHYISQHYPEFQIEASELILLNFRLLMPLICKDMVDLLDNNSTDAANQSSLSDFAFLYGVFPTAPSVAIYAVYYNAELQVVSWISAFMSPVADLPQYL